MHRGTGEIRKLRLVLPVKAVKHLDSKADAEIAPT